MLRGLNTAAAGMITQQRKHDTATDNIANMNTPGFKQGVSVSRSFPETLIMLMNGGEGIPNQQIGRIHTGAMVEETMFPLIQGALVETGKATDFALAANIPLFLDGDEEQPVPFDASGKYVTEDGETLYQPQALFTVLNENDERRYTRNGQFIVNADGQLVTMSGHRVLGSDEQPLAFDLDTGEVRVNERGELFDPVTGAPILNEDDEPLSLLISRVDNPYDLVREGDSLFRLETEDDNPAVPIEDPAWILVRQGYIERSNVDPTVAMTNMMMASRAYETNQRIVQMYDQTLDKTVNEIGRLG